MKAVIMAGGKGTRLRPLTCNLPKPMVPLLERPCMEYIIELLKRYGIHEIAVTVQYLPQMIKNYFGDGSEFGVKLHYFDETSPLGTAGSVKNAEEFLDETFLVISGDSLTDFDLNQAIAFHRQKRAIGTLVLTHVDVPLEFGVVMTEENGQIVRFLEKPSWSEVFSDTVNTGIYVLEPEILTLFKSGMEFDFSKDLFPLVMKRDLPLYGYVANGYWSDIGNLTQYRQTQFDMLNGLVDVRIKGYQIQPQVWVGEGVTVHNRVNLEGPAYIGEGTEIKSAAKIGPFAVLGSNNLIETGAAVEQAVIWNRNHVGKSANLAGTTLCNGAQVGAGVSLQEDTVVGDKTWIGEMAVIQSGVKIWPGKNIGAGTVQHSSLIWGKSASRSLFGKEGISGIPNFELTPELAGRIAAAYVSCLPRGGKVSVSCDEDPYSKILKYAVVSSLLAYGIAVWDLRITPTPVARYQCRRLQNDGGIHICKTAAFDGNPVLLQFFDRDGLPIDKGMERRIENAFLQEDFTRPDQKGVGQLNRVSAPVDAYLEELFSLVDAPVIQSRKLKVVCQCQSVQTRSILYRLLETLGCSFLSVMNGSPALENVVVEYNADLGIQIDARGQNIRIWTEEGYLLSEEEFLLLLAVIANKGKQPVAIPVNAPSVVEKMLEFDERPMVWTKTVSRSILEVGKVSPLQPHFDGFYSLAAILEHLTLEQTTLQTILESFPEFHMSTEFVTCPIDVKGRVMRRLMEDMKGQILELVDGIKVRAEEGWALILPDSEKAQFKIVAQGASPTKALELTEIYKSKIVMFQKEA